MKTRVRMFSVLQYVEAALALAVYERDEGGVFVACVPGAAGFFSQGDSVEEARSYLREAIEGNVLLALQLGLPIPPVPGVDIVDHQLAADE